MLAPTITISDRIAFPSRLISPVKRGKMSAKRTKGGPFRGERKGGTAQP